MINVRLGWVEDEGFLGNDALSKNVFTEKSILTMIRTVIESCQSEFIILSNLITLKHCKLFSYQSEFIILSNFVTLKVTLV